MLELSSELACQTDQSAELECKRVQPLQQELLRLLGVLLVDVESASEPARSFQPASPTLAKQNPEHSKQSDAHSKQSDAHSRQSDAHSRQSPTAPFALCATWSSPNSLGVLSSIDAPSASLTSQQISPHSLDSLQQQPQLISSSQFASLLASLSSDKSPTESTSPSAPTPRNLHENALSNAPAREQRYLLIPLYDDRGTVGVIAQLLPPTLPPEAALARANVLQASCNFVAHNFLHKLELERWLDVTAPLAEFRGACAVLDEANQTLLWVGTNVASQNLEEQVWAKEDYLLELIHAHARNHSPEPPPCPAFSFGKIIHVALDRRLHAFQNRKLTVVAIRPLETSASVDLSQREEQVARLLMDGFSTLNAAAILKLSEGTVRTYVKRLYAKLGVRSRTELLRAIQAHGIRLN